MNAQILRIIYIDLMQQLQGQLDIKRGNGTQTASSDCMEAIVKLSKVKNRDDCLAVKERLEKNGCLFHGKLNNKYIDGIFNLERIKLIVVNNDFEGE